MAKSTKTRRLSFSERNGYIVTTDVMILEKVPKEISNAISSALFRVFQNFKSNPWIMPGEISKEQILHNLC